MMRIRIECEGFSPLLTERICGGVVEEKLYQQDGRNGIPPILLSKCLLEAASVRGWRGLFLKIEEPFLYFKHGTQWRVDVRNGFRGRQQISIVRPRFDTWGFSVTLKADEKCVTEEDVRQLFTHAGFLVGLGSYCPAHRGPFGRFRVTRWQRLD